MTTQNLIGTENAGFKIIEVFETEEKTGIILAEKIKCIYEELETHVTWQFNYRGNEINYFWGHYIKGETEAREDFKKRIQTYLEN